MLRSKFLSLLVLVAIGGAGALYGFTSGSPTAKAAGCACCVAELCTCEPCVCSCEGSCAPGCEDCAECCATCPGCGAAAATAAAVNPAAACESGCCAKTAAK